MSNRDQYFKGQQDGEELICFMRHHWIVLLKEFCYFGIFAVVVYYTIAHVDVIQNVLRGNREMKLLFFTGFLFMTIFIHRFFIKLLNFFLNICIITDVRVIEHHMTLFFKDSIDAIDMGQIQNLERVREGILPSLLGYGDIVIFLTASASAKTLHYIPNAKFHFRCISRQKEARQMAMREHRNVDAHVQFEPQSIVHSVPIPIEEKSEKFSVFH